MTRATCTDSESIDDSRACLFIIHPPLQQRGGAQGGSMMRARLAALARAFKREMAVYRCALRHPRTPLAARLLLGAAVGYALLPFDLIPDFLPVIGQLDDLIIVPGLIWLALRMLPPAVMDECRVHNPRSENLRMFRHE